MKDLVLTFGILLFTKGVEHVHFSREFWLSLVNVRSLCWLQSSNHLQAIVLFFVLFLFFRFPCTWLDILCKVIFHYIYKAEWSHPCRVHTLYSFSKSTQLHSLLLSASTFSSTSCIVYKCLFFSVVEAFISTLLSTVGSKNCMQSIQGVQAKHL